MPLLLLFNGKTPTTTAISSTQDIVTFKEGHSLASKGHGWDIFKPYHAYQSQLVNTPRLLASPETWLPYVEEQFKTLDSMVISGIADSHLDRARGAYAQVLLSHVSGSVYRSWELSITPGFQGKKLWAKPYDPDVREKGGDWAYLGVTMTGATRLNNVEHLLRDVFKKGIGGDYIETGVWRGGASIFARGVMRAHGQGHRLSYVCDSFRGLPSGERALDPRDKNWDSVPYLEVSTESVATNFAVAGLLDPNVVFVKGFFKDTIPHLSPSIKSLAIMRLDGDMYESTVDVLYHLYEKLSIGGYVIMDDWDGFPSKTACEDFFAVHKINPTIIRIDDMSAYWQKTENIKIHV